MDGIRKRGNDEIELWLFLREQALTPPSNVGEDALEGRESLRCSALGQGRRISAGCSSAGGRQGFRGSGREGAGASSGGCCHDRDRFIVSALEMKRLATNHNSILASSCNLLFV